VREAKLTEPQIQVRMDRDLRDALEAFRGKESDLPTRPEAIRRLLKTALSVTAQTDPANA
jgi:hypothetical protein